MATKQPFQHPTWLQTAVLLFGIGAAYASMDSRLKSIESFLTELKANYVPRAELSILLDKAEDEHNYLQDQLDELRYNEYQTQSSARDFGTMGRGRSRARTGGR